MSYVRFSSQTLQIQLCSQASHKTLFADIFLAVSLRYCYLSASSHGDSVQERDPEMTFLTRQRAMVENISNRNPRVMNAYL